jgi:hypothetical protein
MRICAGANCNKDFFDLDVFTRHQNTWLSADTEMCKSARDPLLIKVYIDDMCDDKIVNVQLSSSHVLPFFINTWIKTPGQENVCVDANIGLSRQLCWNFVSTLVLDSVKSNTVWEIRHSDDVIFNILFQSRKPCKNEIRA